MEEFDKLFERIDSGEGGDQIRLDIADLIARSLDSLRDSFGYWEKAHMASAIAFLALNGDASIRSSSTTTSWLTVSLAYAQKALVPKEQRSENHIPADRRLEAVTFDQLRSAIRSLGAN